MPSWNDLGTAFSTLREIDVTVIREESERAITIAVIGAPALYANVVTLLRTRGSQHYGPGGADPFAHYAFPLGAPPAALSSADLLLVLVDAASPFGSVTAETIMRLARLALPTVIVIWGRSAPGELGAPRPEFAHARIVVLPDPSAPTTAELLAEALLDRLPEELRLAAARAVPGLRPVYTRELISAVSVTNGSYALASSIPQQIPILAVPFAAADIIVLTKNQALMVYRLALAHGAPPEFQARIAELAPVIGGAFVWRQLARTLVSLIPFWGVVPKVAVAYAGTYSTGMAAARWFAAGELISGERLRELTTEAMRIGRERAVALIEAAREARKERRRAKGGSASLPTNG